MSITLQLPIPCKRVFRLKPFLATYLNDYKEERTEHNHYKVLHLAFNGLHEPQKLGACKVKGAKVPFSSPHEKGLDEDSDEESDDGMDAADAAHANVVP